MGSKVLGRVRNSFEAPPYQCMGYHNQELWILSTLNAVYRVCFVVGIEGTNTNTAIDDGVAVVMITFPSPTAWKRGDHLKQALGPTMHSARQKLATVYTYLASHFDSILRVKKS